MIKKIFKLKNIKFFFLGGVILFVTICIIIGNATKFRGYSDFEKEKLDQVIDLIEGYNNRVYYAEDVYSELCDIIDSIDETFNRNLYDKIRVLRSEFKNPNNYIMDIAIKLSDFKKLRATNGGINK